MDINVTLLGQYMVIHIVVVSALTFLYGRRKDIHSVGSNVLVVFAWIFPILGPICLVAFLVGRRESSAI
jgi:hypothetical protein